MTRRGDVAGFAHCGGFTRRLPPNVKLVMLNPYASGISNAKFRETTKPYCRVNFGMMDTKTRRLFCMFGI